MTTPKEKAVSAPTENRPKEIKPSQHYADKNPLMEWFDLGASAKASRIERKQKRGWKRGEK